MQSETNSTATTSPQNLATEPTPVALHHNPFDAANPLPAPLEFQKIEPWPEPVDGKLLLDDLEHLVKRFLILPEGASPTLALWVLHTYAFQFREVSTYLGIESPEKRCGKTTLLMVLHEVVHRSIAASNISYPALFRVIAEMRPTMLIDEADTLLQGNDELRGILNSGYTRKTAFVVRVASHAPRNPLSPPPAAANLPQPTPPPSPVAGTQLARYSSWCPKAMAAIGHLPETLADRCILIRMQRKTESETCERLCEFDGTPFRRRCARFIRDHVQDIAAARPQLPASLHDRAGDIWEPLLILADLAGGDWPKKARQAATHATNHSQQSNPTAALLLDIVMIFADIKRDRIFSHLLVDTLNLAADRPWRDLMKGKPLTETWLAQRLRQYGITSKNIRQGADVAKGYMQNDFNEAFRRYVPRAALKALSAELSESGGPAPAPAATGPAARTH